MKPCRWFRYSLRTFFVLVTVFCVWLGAQVKWISDRRDAREWIKPYGRINDATGRYARAPWSIRILGENSVQSISLDVRLSRAQIHELAELFPECYIVH